MTIYLDKERASSEANAYVARVLAESSFWMAACALALSTAIVVVVVVYLAMYQTNHCEKNDNADNIKARSAMTIPQLERYNAFSANTVCFLDSVTSSSCRNFSVILRDSMPGKFSHRLSLVMHNNNEFDKIAQEHFFGSEG